MRRPKLASPTFRYALSRSLPRLGRTARRLAGITGAVAALVLAPGAIMAQDGQNWGDDVSGYDSSYSYLRAIDGSATLITPENSDRETAQINQPILPGDRLWVSRGSRAEVVLSDYNILRLDADTEVLFEQLTGTPEDDASTTVLRLMRGNVQLVVVDRALGDELPRIDTPNSTIYAVEAGTFRITADGSDWTEALVREGVAEVVSRRGSTLVQAGEEAFIEGSTWPEERLSEAGRFDSLERWGEALDDRARHARYDDIDDDLRYSASSLDGHGQWLSVEGRRAWRPTRVATDWRPYHDGRWVSTPAGLAWHSYEPWGWVPYHYGTWDYAPSYGWVWFPGRIFRPAWVYWNFTDDYAAWVPFGYYSRHYGRRHGHRGFRFGVYGWAGGSWDYYRNWIFCPVGYLGYRRQNDYAYYGHRQPERYRRHPVPRGVLTADTRGLRPDRIRRPHAAVNLLTDGKPDALRDVTGFVARKPALTPDVQRQVFADTSRNSPNRRVPAVVVDDGGIPVGILATRPGRAGGSRDAGQAPDRGRRVISSVPARGAGASGSTTGSDSWRRPSIATRPATGDRADSGRWRDGARRPTLNTKPGGSARQTPATSSSDAGRQVQRPSVNRRPSRDAGRAIPPRGTRSTGNSGRPSSGRLRSTAPPTAGRASGSSSTARRPDTRRSTRPEAKPPRGDRRGSLRSSTPPRDRSRDAGRSTSGRSAGSSSRGVLRPSKQRPTTQRPSNRRSTGARKPSTDRPRGTLAPRSGSGSKSSASSSRRSPTRRPSVAPKSSSRRSKSSASTRSSSRPPAKSSARSSSRSSSSSSKSKSSSSSRRSTGRRPPV